MFICSLGCKTEAVSVGGGVEQKGVSEGGE